MLVGGDVISYVTEALCDISVNAVKKWGSEFLLNVGYNLEKVVKALVKRSKDKNIMQIMWIAHTLKKIGIIATENATKTKMPPILYC